MVILTGPLPVTDNGWQLGLPSPSVAVRSPLVVEAGHLLTGGSIQIVRVHEHEDG